MDAQPRRPRKGRRRLDSLAAEIGLFPSREKARAAILAGELTVDGVSASKPGTLVKPDAVIEVTARRRFVSRGGDKLEGALERLGLDVSGRVALDVGASTGGFTDCLLQRGVAHVTAVDVGYAQLAWKLRQDPRVTVLERQNIRKLTREGLLSVLPGGVPLPGLAAIDLSFIGLEKVFPVLITLLRPGAPVMALVKPQFQVGRGLVGKGGVVRRRELQVTAIVDAARAAREEGFAVLDLTYSDPPGPSGNLEYFLLLETPGGAGKRPPSSETGQLENIRQHLDAASIAVLAEKIVDAARSTLGV